MPEPTTNQPTISIVKIRRVGNSNTISLPRWLADKGFDVGTEVIVDLLPTGEVILSPAEAVRQHVRNTAREVIRKRRGALDALAAYDRGELKEEQVGDLVQKSRRDILPKR